MTEKGELRELDSRGESGSAASFVKAEKDILSRKKKAVKKSTICFLIISTMWRIKAFGNVRLDGPVFEFFFAMLAAFNSETCDCFFCGGGV